MPIIWGLANPKIGERDAVRALFEHDHHVVGSGQVILADKGFAGRDFQTFVTGLGARLIRPDREDEPTRLGKLSRVRQWIEAIIDTLKGPAHPRRPRRTLPHRSPRPRRRPPARPGRCHLAQLDHRRTRQTIPDHLRPLKINRTHSSRV